VIYKDGTLQKDVTEPLINKVKSRFLKRKELLQKFATKRETEAKKKKHCNSVGHGIQYKRTPCSLLHYWFRRMSQKHNFWTSFDLSVSYFLSSDEIAFLQHSHGIELVATSQLLLLTRLAPRRQGPPQQLNQPILLSLCKNTTHPLLSKRTY